MKKRLSILGSLIILLIFLFSGICFAGNVTIEADKQDYDTQAKLITFQGNVKAKYDNITVKSPKAFVKTDANNKPSEATFIQGAYIVKEDANSKSEVKASIIKLSLLDNNVKAEGDTESIVTKNKKPLIVIKASSQEFDMSNKIILADGNVTIDYADISNQKNITTNSEKAKIFVDKAGKPQQVFLAGNAKIVQDKTIINASKFFFNISNNELIASGTTHSQTTLDDGTPVSIWSNTQDYNKETNALMAGGNVKAVYKDYTATGPKAIFSSTGKSSKPDKIIFIGRSTIHESDRIVEANKIEITLNPKSFKAEGNVKTRFTQVQAVDSNPNDSNKQSNPKNVKNKQPAQNIHNERSRIKEEFNMDNNTGTNQPAQN